MVDKSVSVHVPVVLNEFFEFLSVNRDAVPGKNRDVRIWRHRRHETYARDLHSHFWNVQNVGRRHPPSAYSFRPVVRRVRTRQENSVRVSCRSPSKDTWRRTHTVSTSPAWLTIAATSPSLVRPPIAVLMKRLPKHLANTTKHRHRGTNWTEWRDVGIRPDTPGVPVSLSQTQSLSLSRSLSFPRWDYLSLPLSPSLSLSLGISVHLPSRLFSVQ